ncbi:MAG TPA: hypothetical protein G4N93_02115 [Dehalococcoidia bacterium]|nr:hypothetical protein [Dehalococcoidia bacterium]
MDTAVNAIVGIPKINDERNVDTDPASAIPQSLLLIEQIPPSVDKTPGTITAAPNMMIEVVPEIWTGC